MGNYEGHFRGQTQMMMIMMMIGDNAVYGRAITQSDWRNLISRFGVAEKKSATLLEGFFVWVRTVTAHK